MAKYLKKKISKMSDDITQKLFEVLKSGQHEYYSLPSLSGITGVAPSELKTQLEGNKLIRKSVLTDENNNPIYTLNTPLSAVKDFLNAARYMNYLKTE